MESLADFGFNLCLQAFLSDSLESWIFRKLAAGRRDRPAAPEFGELPDDVRVLHHGKHFLVLNKDHDVIINHDDPARPSVAIQLQRKFPHLYDKELLYGFRFAHRLDYPTSGALAIALTKDGASVATKAFSQQKSSKFYLAIVRGHVTDDCVHIDLPIGEVAADDDLQEWGKAKMATPWSRPDGLCAKARRAETKMVVMSRGLMGGGYPATKVLLQPLTGRRHQLRLHCSDIGHTIVGDFTYSNRRDTRSARMYLHAQRLVLPNSLEPLDVDAGDPFKPSDFQHQKEDSNRYLETQVIFSQLDKSIYRVFQDQNVRWKRIRFTGT